MMRRPLPFEAEEKYIKELYYKTCAVLNLYGDEFVRLGMNACYDDHQHEVLVEIRSGKDSDFCIYEDMLKKGSIFWEFRFCQDTGDFYFTIMHHHTKYTVFCGEEVAKFWELKFDKPYLLMKEEDDEMRICPDEELPSGWGLS